MRLGYEMNLVGQRLKKSLIPLATPVLTQRSRGHRSTFLMLEEAFFRQACRPQLFLGRQGLRGATVASRSSRRPLCRMRVGAAGSADSGRTCGADEDRQGKER